MIEDRQGNRKNGENEVDKVKNKEYSCIGDICVIQKGKNVRV